MNNHSLRGVSHEQAISALRKTPTKVRLLIYRDLNLQLSLLDPTQIYNIFEMELTKKPGRGLGLSIVGRKAEPGVYVSEVCCFLYLLNAFEANMLERVRDLRPIQLRLDIFCRIGLL